MADPIKKDGQLIREQTRVLPNLVKKSIDLSTEPVYRTTNFRTQSIDDLLLRKIHEKLNPIACFSHRQENAL